MMRDREHSGPRVDAALAADVPYCIILKPPADRMDRLRRPAKPTITGTFNDRAPLSARFS
jgi:hypothetical protein